VNVYVVVADYGLNGAGILGVFSKRPSDEAAERLANTSVDPERPWATPVSVTGFGGWEIEECEVHP
jgi:hypothetical protein